MNEKTKTANQEGWLKRFLRRIVEKLDRRMEEKSRQPGCCCKGGSKDQSCSN